MTSATISNINSPTIQQRRLKTTVAVYDGTTVVLGSLIQQCNTNLCCCSCMSPGSTADGHDAPRLVAEPVPGVAAQRDDLFVGFEKLLVFLAPYVIRNLPAAIILTERLKQDMEEVLNALDELPKHRYPRRPW